VCDRMMLELGCGNKPTPGFVHHDKWMHSPHVDMSFDLAVMPWPLEDGSLRSLLAVDVFEHLKLDVQGWMDECHRVLKEDGILEFRVPAWDNPYSYRDPTHYRVFHPESFYYWCPNAPGTVWKDFGRYYFGEGYDKWWEFLRCDHECKDLRFLLRKPCATE
jgi:SAM-dependent methyltransferase